MSADNWCDEHGSAADLCPCATAERDRRVRADRDHLIDAMLIEISPAGYAHLPGCWHKGDDTDRTGWGSIESVPGAWRAIVNKQPIMITGGDQRGGTIAQACRDCVGRPG